VKSLAVGDSGREHSSFFYHCADELVTTAFGYVYCDVLAHIKGS
jgi:hypothetical protein